MLPVAPSTPITVYNKATTSPPTNWLLDPAPAIKFCSKVESIPVCSDPIGPFIVRTDIRAKSGQVRPGETGRHSQAGAVSPMCTAAAGSNLSCNKDCPRMRATLAAECQGAVAPLGSWSNLPLIPG